MKFALVQRALPTTGANVDFTDSNISSDWKFAYLFGNSAQANDTSTANARYFSGMLDGTTSGSVAIAATDNQATSATSGNTTTNALQVVNGNAGTQTAGTYSSTLATGPRINFTSGLSAAYLANALLLSGSDIEATVKSAVFTGSAAPETLVVNHSLSGGAPHLIIAEAYLGSSRVCIGFYDVGNAKYASHSYTNVSGQVGAVSLGGYVSDDCILREITNSASAYAITVTSIGSTSVSLVATGATTTDTVKLTFVRIANASFRVGVFQTPTSTGDFALTPASPSFSGTPSLLWVLPTRMTTLNTHDSGDPAGVYGSGIAVNNNGTIQQMCTVLSSDDAAALSVEKSYITTSKTYVSADTTGAPDAEATTTFVLGGATLNFSNVAASAFYTPYLMVGLTVPPPAFTVSPTVTSQTATTLVQGYTPDASATFYTAAVPAGASTPSAAQIIAGTGGGILFAASEAVTGADTTTLTLSGTLFPKYKLCSLLSNAGGNSSIVTLDNQFLTAPTGKQFQVLTTPLASTSPLINASPAIATNDVWVIDTLTSLGYAITTEADGDLNVASGDESAQTVAHDVYDDSLAAYYGAGTIYLNYLPPIFFDVAVYAFPLNIAITPVDLRVLAEDPQGNALVVTAIGTLPTGLSIVSSSLTGTPTAKAITTGTYRWTGVSGDYTEGELTLITGTVTVPDVFGFSYDDANTALGSVFLNLTGGPGDTVTGQNPAAAAEVDPFTGVALTFLNDTSSLLGASALFRITIRIGF